MPLTARRRTSGVTLSAALVAVTLAAHAAQASAADTPPQRVLTYNMFLRTGLADGQGPACRPHL
ncbi:MULTISPECIES: hypothetical protein [unclassified Streptomyces]|uniref:hypothetical protein n=1 Tax=unclassified Streptomyces TaxID=2593676 RepID=UPI002DDBC486|nr:MULTISPECIES: hypothetical protein [unclassified Streptomyces]WSC52579.1 hypothetical protein OG808_10200 [Streptomyces sp. NBC_01761]WSF83427.1 hypothetical protein OIE70_10290 [Streptomyces sp. NBC_01744]WSJ49894.1 hypothetical protein OG243_10315 [Streptomyces sp. NBC_01318]